MPLDLGVSLTVNTSSLKNAITEVDNLKKAIDGIKMPKSTKTDFDVASKGAESFGKSAEKAGKKSISVLERQRLIAKFLAGDFTKGEASILATGKAAGLTNKQMKELENTLKQIFKLSGKNPFDDSVDPLRRLTAESEKLVNKMKVLRGETTLTAKQLEELTIRQARVEASARANGLRGAALQSTINKATREYIALAESVNSKQAQYNVELEKTKQKRREEQAIYNSVGMGISNAIKQQERLSKLVEETALKAKLMQQGLSTTTANMVVRAVRGGASESGPEVASLIASRKAIESVNESKKKLAETSSATYQAIVEGNKKAKFHVDGLQAAVRAVIPGFGALTAAAVGATIVSGAIRAADAYRGLQERLKLVTQSEQERVEVTRRLLDISNQNFASLQETTNLYIKLRPALAAVGGTQADTLAVTNAFSKSLAISGTNTKEAAAATLQFAQALGSGKLAGDEFRSISEAAPAVLQAIAAGTGKTTGELKKLASEGFLTTATVSKALISQLTAIEIKFGLLQPTIGQALNVLSNNTTNLIAKFDQATGFTKGFANTLLGIGNILGGIVPGIQSLGRFLSENSEAFSQAVISIGAYILISQRAAITTLALNTVVAAGIAIERTFIALSATKTAALGAMTIATTTYTLAGKGFTGVLAVMSQGVAALTAALIRNPFMLIATGLAAIGAYLAGDKIEKFFSGIGQKFSSFGSEVGSGAVKLEDGVSVLEKLNKEIGLIQKGTDASKAQMILTSEQAINEEYKQRIELANEFKGKDQERYIALLKEATLIKKSREDLQKLRTGENIKDQKTTEPLPFDLGRINRDIDTRIQGEKKLFDFRRDLIDRSLQYDLVTAGVAEIQKQRLAEETYNREKALLEEQKRRISAEALTGKDQEARNQQQRQKDDQIEVLNVKIQTLDIDRQRTLEIARVVSLGEQEKRAFEANRDIRKIEADILEDINRKQQEFNNRFTDPAVLAAQQARAAAADKYTQKIAEAQAQLGRINNSIERISNDEGLLNKALSEREEIQEIINRLLEDQARLSNAAAESARKQVEESRTLEEGFKRAFKTFREEQSDLSRISENFARGFFQEFDKAFMDIFESGKISFGNLFNFIKNEIKKLAIQKLLLEPIKAALLPFLEGFGSAVLGTIAGGSVGASGALSTGTGIVKSIGNVDLKVVLEKFSTSVGGTTGNTINSTIGKLSNVFTNATSGIQSSINTGITSVLTNSQNQTLSRIGGYFNEQFYKNSLSSGSGFPSSSTTSVANVGAGIVGGIAGSAAMKKVSGGYETSGVVGKLNSLGPAIGSAIGSAFGPIGTFVGGVLGGVASGVFNRGFGKKVSLGASGIQGEFSTEGFSGQAFQDIITKKGKLRGGGSRTSTNFSAIYEEALNVLADSTQAVFNSVKGIGNTLGVDAVKALEDFKLQGRFSVSTAEELQKTLQRVSDAMIEKAIPGIKEFAKAGESLLEVATKLSSAVSSANRVMIALGKATAFSFSNIQDAVSLVNNLGEQGIGNLNTYLERFVPESERAGRAIVQFNNSVREAGIQGKVSANTTREEFKKLVESLDLTTESGQRELATLLSIAPELDNVISLREKEAESSKELAKAMQELVGVVINEAIGSIDKQIDRVKTASDTFEDSAKTFLDISKKLKNAGRDLTLEALGDSSVAKSSRFQETFSKAIKGDKEALEALNDSAKDLFSEISQTAISRSDLLAQAGVLSSQLDEAEKVSAALGKNEDYQSKLLKVQSLILEVLKEGLSTGTISERLLRDSSSALKDIDAEVFNTGSKTLEQLLSVEDAQLANVELSDLIASFTGSSETLLGAVLNRLTLEDTGTVNIVSAIQEGNLEVSAQLERVIAAVRQQSEVAAAEAKRQKDLAFAQSRLQDIATARNQAISQVSAAAGQIIPLASQFGVGLENISSQRASFGVNENGLFTSDYYQDRIGRGSNQAGFQSRFYGSGGLYDQTYGRAGELQSLFDSLNAQRELIRSLGGIPQFYTGGDHTGGLAIVGERGPELVSMGPARVFNAQQTSQMINSRNNERAAEEIAQLRADLRASQTAIAGLQARMVRIFERWDGSGIPETRNVT
jgi:tape measure domain-containing protein